MSSSTRYVKGDYKAVCDSCGQRFLASKLRKRWDGLIVCPADYEVRHPQDFVRAKVDIQAVPWARPESEDYQFVPIDYGKQFYDTVRVRDAATISSVYGRVFTELLVTSSTISLGSGKSFTDSVTTLSSISLGSNKTIADSVSTGESGSILSQDYIDPTYFAEAYVGTSVTF